VELRRQADPAQPSRNNQAIDREVFTNLSLDPRHSRYFQEVIGATWDLTDPTVTADDSGRPLRREDRRSEGGSDYVRVWDLAPGNGLRQPPVATYEPVPGGVPRLVLLPLDHGDEPPFGDGDFIGVDNPDPDQRTGVFSLRNINEISIVAAPGRTSVQIQEALINHCELMRYRFAVLDGTAPPDDAMANIQAQRQQFDTKYAALYHPWLLIPDPYPVTLGQVPDYPVPPSGHVVGIYARTDIERGVHKAPANEVVRGITGLARTLNKEQQDILNPYPVNINVIRDFRSVNRAIRVYGGRCITSDSDWKYVNVRRLLIFIEASIDQGLQWVVFEPNAEPLWARVRRSISNFLTLVWRNGALEGTKPEEAYFVKCDRTTMTQTDIDEGRLIILVGVAPVKPAEFVIVRIGLWTANADDQ
jgi:phage tail sheath protein FI